MKKVLFVLLAAVIAFSFLSCEKEKEMTETESKEPVELVFNNEAEPESLDPAIIEGVPEHNIYMMLFEGLVTYDPETLDAVPGVAESWDVSDDGLTWTFNLRDDAVWTDGTPVTAQQFVDSWLRFLNPETAAAYTYMMNMVIEGASAYNSGEAGPEAVQIRALDDKTFQFDLVGPAPYVLGMLSHYAFAVHPTQTVEEFGSEWTKPENIVTNGPFKLAEWMPHDKIVVEKNESYWDAENVQLDKITVYPIDDQNTSLNMYKQGEIDWIQTVPQNMIEEMKLDDNYHVNASFITYYYFLNTEVEPLDDVRVRKALGMTIDRQELVDQVTREGQFPAYGITPPLANYPAVEGFEEDFDAARELLAEAGFPNGEGFPEFTILYNTSEGHKAIAEYVQQKWKEELNIDVTIENQEWATFISNRQGGNFEIGRAGWQGDYVDPNTFLDMFIKGSGNNDGRYDNPEYDALIRKASLMPGGEERYAVLREAEELLIDEMAIIPFYFYTTSNWIDTDTWGGWYETILDVHPFKFIYKK